MANTKAWSFIPPIGNTFILPVDTMRTTDVQVLRSSSCGKFIPKSDVETTATDIRWEDSQPSGLYRN
jgi:hypothetical protein